MNAPGRETKPPDGHREERVWLRGFEAGVIQMRHDFAGLIAERDALAARVERLEAALRDVIEGWDWWNKDQYDRCQSVPGDAIDAARAALSTAQEAQ